MHFDEKVRNKVSDQIANRNSSIRLFPFSPMFRLVSVSEVVSGWIPTDAW